MTAAAPQLLTTPTLHSDLRRMVRRRVPDRDVEDIVQEVLCDALARPLPASSPRDVARWVMAIAKNKVADYHRRAGRELPSDELEIGASSSVVEDRDLLGAVLREAAADPRGSETLDWLVREHEGETLGSIAAEVRLEAAAVRQRVSRFRKRLRVALLVAAALSAGGLVWWSAGALTSEPVIAEREIAIVPDAPTAAEVPSPAASTIRAGALSSLDGAWQVDAAEPAEGTPAALRAVVAAQRAITTITVSGTDVVIASPAREVRGALSLRSTAPNRWVGTLTTDRGSSPVEVTYDGGRATVTATGGPLRGTVVLSR